MPYFILGLAFVIGLYFLVRGLRGTNSANVQRIVAVVIGVVAAILLIFFAVSGRMGAFGWVVLLLPLLLRWRAISQAMRNLKGPSPGRNSDIETLYLRMTLEHDSGVLRGTVLRGTFEGRNLEELSLAELVDLLHECRVNDPQSATVLESYLDRVHGGEWRDTGAGAGAGDGGRSGGNAAAGGGTMTRDEAYEVLGLKPGASDAEIREAHRKLLMANHPDKGGSTYLAAKINQAKDVLLSGA
tara:strand:- start:8010 stop:8735 length:726 start_codon:yes stop_codon:yes gene_type:complete